MEKASSGIEENSESTQEVWWEVVSLPEKWVIRVMITSSEQKKKNEVKK